MADLFSAAPPGDELADAAALFGVDLADPMMRGEHVEALIRQAGRMHARACAGSKQAAELVDGLSFVLWRCSEAGRAVRQPPADPPNWTTETPQAEAAELAGAAAEGDADYWWQRD